MTSDSALALQCSVSLIEAINFCQQTCKKLLNDSSKKQAFYWILLKDAVSEWKLLKIFLRYEVKNND